MLRHTLIVFKFLCLEALSKHKDALSSDRANATLRNSTGLDGPESGPNKNHVASLPFAKVTPQEQSSITPTPLPTSQPGSNTTQNTYFQPAFSHGANPSNPTSWKSQPTPNFAYTRNGGRRDMSQQHQFVNMNVGFHGNRTAVDLESTDGAQQIDCNETHWRIQTKDKAHFDVAMSWPHDVILVTGSFCETGETRRLIEVQELSFPEPSVIVANGKPGFLNNGLPVSTVSVEFGNHRPSDSSSALTPIATAPTQPAAQPDQPGPSTVYNKRGWFKSEWSKATSHIGSAASVVTSHVESAASVVTSHVEAAASLHGSTSKSMHIQVPKATPTGTSPFSTTGNKLASFHGMDVWDLGMQVNGGIELGGGFTADLAHIGKKGWASAYMFMHGSDWNFDFPLGLEFQGTNEHYENTNLTIGEPIDLCAEFGCIAVQDIFEIGSFLQMNLNATIDVKTSGKINMGTKYSYAAPQVYWGTDSQNATGFEPSNREKWFNVSDGSIQVSGGLGLDFVQLNGLKITKVKEADFYVQIVDGVSVAATVTKEQKGSSKSRRDISAREHPKDVLARELAKRDTCPGLGVKLELDEALMLQADAGPFNGGATLFATQIPLYSTCIS
ncbi:MAG: hypothetical protein Q9157_001621 [Trypethelium eluteriae]